MRQLTGANSLGCVSCISLKCAPCNQPETHCIIGVYWASLMVSYMLRNVSTLTMSSQWSTCSHEHAILLHEKAGGRERREGIGRAGSYLG